jgi:metallo-beta-lactamase family protein
MCTGGRIKHHLKNNVWRRDAHVVMVGFQAGGTPGRALVDGARKLRIFGDEMDVQARVHTIGGLSAHAGQDGLLSWYESFEGHPPVTLVHGEESAMARLQQLLRQRFDADVTMPEFGERLDL